MKTYEVELKRVSYIVLTVEAESEEEAESKAYEEADLSRDNHADWSLESICEMDEENLEIAIDDISHINEQEGESA
jgi:hypothetical protein